MGSVESRKRRFVEKYPIRKVVTARHGLAPGAFFNFCCIAVGRRDGCVTGFATWDSSARLKPENTHVKILEQHPRVHRAIAVATSTSCVLFLVPL